jgi:hypothetical protein
MLSDRICDIPTTLTFFFRLLCSCAFTQGHRADAISDRTASACFFQSHIDILHLDGSDRGTFRMSIRVFPIVRAFERELTVVLRGPKQISKL